MRHQFIFTLALAALFTLAASARPVSPRINTGDEPEARDIFTPSLAKSGVDTTYLLGGPGMWDGRFESPGGQPDWHGWTGEDLTSGGPDNHWHVSTYQADQIPGKDPGNQAMYCGDENIPACDPPDIMGGYGPGWREQIEWRQVVGDPGQSVTVRVTGVMRYDTEVGYDFVILLLQRADDIQILNSWDGTGTATLDYSAVLDPGEFTGPGNDEVRLAWFFWSDVVSDDEDCQNPTSGACQIDDLTVYLDAIQATFDDFEPGSPVNWTPAPVQGVGDFSSLRNNLQSVNPDQAVNASYQVNFVDDGIVVPGTGGTPCINWCYGPDGWILNHDGGTFGGPPDLAHLNNQVVSPPLAWPGSQDGAHLAFDAYLHEPLSGNSPGMFGFWYVRSTASSDPADIQNAPWVNRNFYLPETVFGGFLRFEDTVADLLVPDRQWVQIALGVQQIGFTFGIDGPNGTPSPYFDNVAFKVWDPEGPVIEMALFDKFGDAFPQAGVLDPVDLAANSCRVDRVGQPFQGARGDSLVAEITPLRKGATVLDPPSLHWVMECNPVFDAVRPALPDAQGIVRGSTAGSVALDGNGQTSEGKWAFDLPDTGFFFPGDKLRYYITGGDDLGGDIRTAVWPPDTTGILDFGYSSPYPYQAAINALPSVAQPVLGEFVQPPMLLVDDSQSNAEVRTLWREGLTYLGHPPGPDLDILTIFTNDNLLHYINAQLLSGYETMVYSAGQSFSSLRETAPGVISDWLAMGGKSGLFAGENLVGRLNGGWEVEGSILSASLGVQFWDSRISDQNGSVWQLEVSPLPANGVFPDDLAWQIDAASPVLRNFDAIVPEAPGLSVADLDGAGATGGPFAATVVVDDLGPGNRTAVMPFDLDAIDGMTQSPGKSDKTLSPTINLATYLLTWLGVDVVSGVDDVPGAAKFAVSAHPNPFNPVTTIAFELPRAAEVSLNIFDLQGRLVRRLLDERSLAGGSHQQVWDGQDGKGQVTSSGMYFYLFSSGDQKQVGKLTLLK